MLAERYERDLVPELFEPWARDLVDLAAPRPGERILDVACGTGVVARAAAPRVGPSGTVTGIDVNADMLALARDLCAGLRPPITWKLANALDTGLPDAAFDVVFCQQGFQFFGDRAGVARELRRLAAPGSRVALSVWCDDAWPGYAPFEEAFRRHLPGTPEAAGFVRAIFGLTDPDELHGLLTGAGFGEVEIHRKARPIRYPSPRAWAEAFFGAAPVPGLSTLDPAVRARIIGDAVAGLEACVEDGRLALPAATNMALARP